MTTQTRPGPTPGAVRPVRARVRGWQVRAVAVGAGVAALAVLRPGVLENAARSPRAWLAVAGVVLAGRLGALAVQRATGRPRLASAASALVRAGGALALVLPSFLQRTLVEPPLGPPPAPVAGTADLRPDRRVPGPPADAAAVRVLSSGDLDGVGHEASGRTVLHVSGARLVLRLQDVDIEGTPGPYVHLVRRGARTPDGGVPLGALKAERGTFSYEVPAGVDGASDWSVLIWCRPFATPIAVSRH